MSYLVKMRPRMADIDPSNRARMHAVDSCDLWSRHASGSQCPNLANIVISQLRAVVAHASQTGLWIKAHSVPISRCAPPLFSFVSHIVLMRAKPQMIHVGAAAIGGISDVILRVATVEHRQTVRDGAIRQMPHQAMHRHHLARDLRDAVSVAIGCSTPPQTGCPCLRHKFRQYSGSYVFRGIRSLAARAVGALALTVSPATIFQISHERDERTPALGAIDSGRFASRGNDPAWGMIRLHGELSFHRAMPSAVSPARGLSSPILPCGALAA